MKNLIKFSWKGIGPTLRNVNLKCEWENEHGPDPLPVSTITVRVKRLLVSPLTSVLCLDLPQDGPHKSNRSPSPPLCVRETTMDRYPNYTETSGDNPRRFLLSHVWSRRSSLLPPMTLFGSVRSPSGPRPDRNVLCRHIWICTV